MTQSPKFLNAKQVYDSYGISRGTLARMVEAGRLSVRVIEDDVATLKLYSVEDIEKLINEGSSNERI